MNQSTRVLRGAFGLVFLASSFARQGLSASAMGPAVQWETEVSPDAAPTITQVQPNQAAVGEELTVRIDGQSFSRGVYVSFSNPAVRVVSTRRLNAARVEVKLAIGRLAQPGAVHLYVSNPAGAAAETSFTIIEAKPAPSPPNLPSPPDEPSEAGTPEVTSVSPSRVTPGSHVALKLTGKNFVTGAKVAFSNPDILVLATTVRKPTELGATIDVAKDASTGKTSLFVVNPDDLEVEVPFEVIAQGPAASGGQTGGGQGQRFEVFNLGDVSSILQGVNKPKGALIVGEGKLRYEENGKEIFSARSHDVQEIDSNVFFGVNTGTFHVILNSGKRFNFAPTSLRPTDTEALVNTLRQALH